MDVFNYECDGQLSFFDTEQKPSGCSPDFMNPPTDEIKLINSDCNSVINEIFEGGGGEPNNCNRSTI